MGTIPYLLSRGLLEVMGETKNEKLRSALAFPAILTWIIGVALIVFIIPTFLIARLTSSLTTPQAFDFAFGWFVYNNFSFLICSLLIIIGLAVISYGSKEDPTSTFTVFSGGCCLVFVLGSAWLQFTIGPLLYFSVLSWLGKSINCSGYYFLANHWIQNIIFGSGREVLSIIPLPPSSHFSCFASMWYNPSLSQHPIRISGAYTHLVSFFLGLGFSVNISKLLAGITQFIEFLASVLGIYEFWEKRRKKPPEDLLKK